MKTEVRIKSFRPDRKHNASWLIVLDNGMVESTEGWHANCFDRLQLGWTKKIPHDMVAFGLNFQEAIEKSIEFVLEKRAKRERMNK